MAQRPWHQINDLTAPKQRDQLLTWMKQLETASPENSTTYPSFSAHVLSGGLHTGLLGATQFNDISHGMRGADLHTDSHTHYFEGHIVTTSEALSGIITLISGTYTVGDNSLAVYRNGMRQSIYNSDYVETSSGIITFASGLLATGEYLMMEWYK